MGCLPVCTAAFTLTLLLHCLEVGQCLFSLKSNKTKTKTTTKPTTKKEKFWLEGNQEVLSTRNQKPGAAAQPNLRYPGPAVAYLLQASQQWLFTQKRHQQLEPSNGRKLQPAPANLWGHRSPGTGRERQESSACQCQLHVCFVR